MKWTTFFAGHSDLPKVTWTWRALVKRYLSWKLEREAGFNGSFRDVLEGGGRRGRPRRSIVHAVVVILTAVMVFTGSPPAARCTATLVPCPHTGKFLFVLYSPLVSTRTGSLKRARHCDCLIITVDGGPRAHT